MNAKPAQARKLFSTRRKAVLGLVVIALAVVGWLQYIGAAGISGIPTKDMDWNADGTVTQQEIFQSLPCGGGEENPAKASANAVPITGARTRVRSAWNAGRLSRQPPVRKNEKARRCRAFPLDAQT